ncbi:MAG: methyltransferase domain-containing protein [Halieaceae bacterium]|nr:methyltransferase domain-containing protein [Halieaceae bacterium]
MNNKLNAISTNGTGQKKELEFTGERYLPSVMGQIELEHVHRYIIAREIVQDKVVLDIASGEGYGSNFLAEVASKVIGVDISDETISHANSKYQRENLEFMVGSCANIPLESASVDVVVSFETIEHHAQHEEMMQEIRRVLRLNGVLIISSPDKHEFTEVHNYSTHYHVKELYQDEFEFLLKRYFPNVQLYGQRVGYGSNLAPLEQSSGPGCINYVGNLESLAKKTGVSRPVYFVAVASDHALPVLGGSFLESSLDAMQAKDKLFDEQTIFFQEIVQEKDRQIEDKERLIQEKDAKIANITGSFSWRITKPMRFASRRLVRLISLNGGVIHSIYSFVAHQIIYLKFLFNWVAYLATGNIKYLLKDDMANQALVALKAHNKSTPKRNILLVSFHCPSRAHAGGLRILDLYTQIRKDFPEITIDLYTRKRPEIDESYSDLDKIFDKVYFSLSEYLTLNELLDLKKGKICRYDLIDIQFHSAALDINGFRKLGDKTVFTPMESVSRALWLSIKSSFIKSNKFTLVRVAREFILTILEVIFCFKADQVICVSQADAAFLRLIARPGKIKALETGISPLEFPDSLASNTIEIHADKKENIIVLVAYFGSETNIIATKWFLDNVHPLIKAQFPDYVFRVVGRGDLSPFKGYQDSTIEFVGEVPSIKPYIMEAKVAISPALGGSGFRGKINQYAIFGVPCVASPIAADGLVYQDGHDIFIAAKPAVFARRCIELLKDSSLNETMGMRAREACFAEYTWESKRKAISEIYCLAGNA